MFLEFNEDLIWHCDYLGHEVGYDHVSTVGVYYLKINPAITFYIDMETHEILSADCGHDEE